MKKFFIFGIIAAIALSGCQKEQITENNQESVKFYASIEDCATKTSLDDERNIRWKLNDLMNIFIGSGFGHYNEKWQVNSDADGQTTAELTRIESTSSSDVVLENNVAYYPYAAANTIDKDGANYVVSVTLPATQNYVANSFGNGAFPMVAVTTTPSDNNLKFKNVLGALKLQLKGTSKIKTISVTGNNNEILYGAASVTASNSSTPTIALTDASAKTVTLDCGSGVQLSSANATQFIIALPPMTMTDGFTVNIIDTDLKQMEIKTTKSQIITRSSILKMPEISYEGVAIDLSSAASANCYIVSAPGRYQFQAVKGNSNTLLAVHSVDVLWESFGSDTAPSVGDLITEVTCYSNNYIAFTATDKKGNAVIAAKDQSGNIIWSWHIWLTDKPADQVYNYNAGTMMDRNLGATSATPGDVEALGLLYQWGRKDPFLSSSSISSSTMAASTGTWPDAVTSDNDYGTIDYAIKNPTTFIKANGSNHDWYINEWRNPDNTRWQTKDKDKGLYDPCPPGYRVPNGGRLDDGGVWSNAIGNNVEWTTSTNWDSTNKGMNFGATDIKFGSASTIWYPSTGRIDYNSGEFQQVGEYGACWSCTPHSGSYPQFAYYLYFTAAGHVNQLSSNNYRAEGLSVRCLKE